MTRKECLEYIKKNGYGMEATELARKYHGYNSNKINYTQLNDEILQSFVEGKEKAKKPVVNKGTNVKPLNECVDTKVRKALIAFAELYGHKDIILKNLK